MSETLEAPIDGSVSVSAAYLMVCLCKEDSEAILHSGLMFHKCPQHGYESVPLASLARQIHCCVYHLDEIGDIRPLTTALLQKPVIDELNDIADKCEDASLKERLRAIARDLGAN